MTMPRMRVLVAEDSPSARMLLVHLIESDPRLSVAGTVGDGQSAIDFVASDRPDVVLMDLCMPVLDGFEATRRIMETHPVPIVICTAVADPREMDITFRALEAGALACIEKPVGQEHPGFETNSARLLETLRLMAEVKVVRRTTRPRPEVTRRMRPADWRAPAGIRVIGIGASTGGPPVLQTILSDLPKDFPVPILVVQHIADGFLPGMAEWLNQTSPLHVQIASYGTIPKGGHVYLAPDGYHMGMAGEAISLTREAPENGLRPSVSFLFRSLAESCGSTAAGVLLTGMGRDGAEELKLMRDKGAVTIAQDRRTSAVHGMPGAAIEWGAAMHVLPADKIAEALLLLVAQRNHLRELRS